MQDAPPTVIVTDAHTRMSLALVRELGAAGYTVIGAAQKKYAPLAAKSRYASGKIILDDENLLRMADKYPQAVLLPTGTGSLDYVAAHHGAVCAAFRGLFSTRDARAAAADKPTVAALANSLGLRVPREYPPDAPQLPCVLKYRNADALNVPPAGRYAIAHTHAQYNEASEKMRRAVAHLHSTDAQIFASEYIAGDAFGVSAVLDNSSNALAVFAHRRVREYPITGGPASCAVSVWHYPLVQQALRLFAALGLRGLAMAEFKGSLHAPYLLEVNPRIWGTYPLSSLCGAGLGAAYVRGALGAAAAAIEPVPQYRVGVKMQFLANDAAHFFAWLKKGRLRGGVLWDMLCPRVRGGVFDFRDLPASAAYIANLFRRQP